MRLPPCFPVETLKLLCLRLFLGVEISIVLVVFFLLLSGGINV